MARNLCLSICVIVILSVLYGGPLLSVKENKRKKNKQFHFSECVKTYSKLLSKLWRNYHFTRSKSLRFYKNWDVSQIFIENIALILINVIMMLNIYRTDKKLRKKEKQWYVQFLQWGWPYWRIFSTWFAFFIKRLHTRTLT